MSLDFLSSLGNFDTSSIGDLSSGIGDWFGSAGSGLSSALSSFGSATPNLDLSSFGGFGGLASNALSDTSWANIPGQNTVSPVEVTGAPGAGATPMTMQTSGFPSVTGAGMPDLSGFTPISQMLPGAVHAITGGSQNPMRGPTRQSGPTQNPGPAQNVHNPVQPSQPGQPGGGGILGGVGNFLQNNPSTVLAGLLPMLGNFFKPQLPPQAKKLEAQADKQMDQVNNMIMPTALANQQGMINDQLMRGMDQNLGRQKAAMRKAYADMGMSGSTMEAQDLAGLDQQAMTQQVQIGQQMAQTGLSTAASLSGQASGWYSEVMAQQVQQDKDLEDAIAQIAAAAVKPSTSTNINNNSGAQAPSAQELASGQSLPATLGDFSNSPVTQPFDPVTNPNVIQPQTLPDLSGVTPIDQMTPATIQPYMDTNPFLSPTQIANTDPSSLGLAGNVDLNQIDWSQWPSFPGMGG